MSAAVNWLWIERSSSEKMKISPAWLLTANSVLSGENAALRSNEPGARLLSGRSVAALNRCAPLVEVTMIYFPSREIFKSVGMPFPQRAS